MLACMGGDFLYAVAAFLWWLYTWNGQTYLWLLSHEKSSQTLLAAQIGLRGVGKETQDYQS